MRLDGIGRFVVISRSVPGPTARHAHRCPADESLVRGLRYLSKRMPRPTPAETQEAAVAYDRARQELWRRILSRTCPQCVGEGSFPGWPYRARCLLCEGTGREDLVDESTYSGLRAWVRRRDGGFRLSAQLAEGPDELALLAEARRQRDLAAAGLLGLAAAFARAHRGAGQGLGRGLVLVAQGGDALQGALEQVLRALDRYDPDHRTAVGRGCKASTFCAWYAFKGVQDERLRAADARLTSTAIDHWAAVEDAERDLRQRLGREPTWDEVVEETGRAAALAASSVARILRSGGGGDDRPRDDGEQRPARECVSPLPLPDELLEREEVRLRIDAAAPPGSRRRRVVEAAAFEGPQAAHRAAGSRALAAADVEQVRAALTQTLFQPTESPVMSSCKHTG